MRCRQYYSNVQQHSGYYTCQSVAGRSNTVFGCRNKIIHTRVGGPKIRLGAIIHNVCGIRAVTERGIVCVCVNDENRCLESFPKGDPGKRDR